MIKPVTVLTGFLGSGKSTLANRWLADPRFADTAVLVNEWGAIAIDHALVRASSENILVMAGGCICCRVAGDVVRALRELHFEAAEGRIPAFRRVLIETSGLADPAPLLATLVEMPVVSARYGLSGVVAAVSAVHGARALAEHREALSQVAMADRLVVTQCDLADEPAIASLERELAGLNPGARAVRSVRGDADPLPLLESGLYRGQAARLDATGWLGSGTWRHAGAPRHDPRVASFAWTAQEPLSWHDVEPALETLVDLMGERILRLKGLVNVAGEPGPRAVHAVRHTLYPSARLGRWPDADRSSRIVLIGLDLEEDSVARILDSFLAPVPR